MFSAAVISVVSVLFVINLGGYFAAIKLIERGDTDKDYRKIKAECFGKAFLCLAIIIGAFIYRVLAA